MENVKKCKNFLSTLIKLASSSKQSTEMVAKVKELVQHLLVRASRPPCPSGDTWPAPGPAGRRPRRAVPQSLPVHSFLPEARGLGGGVVSEESCP